MAGLSWWQAVLVLAPLALIAMGGAVGGLIGGAAAGTNAALARRNRFGAGITALAMSTVGLAAYGVYFIVAGALLSAFNSPPQLAAPGVGPTVAATTAWPTPDPTPQQWKPVPAGVAVNQPTVINATGAALTWPAYVNTTGVAPYDVASYEVYRNTLNQDLSRSPGNLVGTVDGDRTSFTDTTAPARTGPHDGIYQYLIGVRTKAGKFIQGAPVLVQLPLPGRTEIAVPVTAADTIASGRPNTVAETVIAQRWLKQLEIGPDEDMGLDNTRLVFGFGPLPALPSGAALVEARLSLWRTSGGDFTDQYTLYALRRTFTGAQVTWNRASPGAAWTRPGGDYGAPTGRAVPSIDATGARSDFDATAAVRGWLRDPRSEHGLLLRADTESVTTAPRLNGFYVPLGGGPSVSNPPSESPELFLTYAGGAPTATP